MDDFTTQVPVESLKWYTEIGVSFDDYDGSVTLRVKEHDLYLTVAESKALRKALKKAEQSL